MERKKTSQREFNNSQQWLLSSISLAADSLNGELCLRSEMDAQLNKLSDKMLLD